jgi:hypothetical protein
MILSLRNLLLHSIALREDDEAVRENGRTYLAGILVDPKSNVAVASDGALLVELPAVDAPSASAEARKLACPLEKEFLLPKDTAADVAKAMRENSLAVVEKAAGSDWSIAVVTDGKKSQPFKFQPVKATFPDYRREGVIFLTKTPKAQVALPTSFAREVLGAVGTQFATAFSVYTEGALLETATKDVVGERGVYLPFAGAYPARPPLVGRVYFVTATLKKLLTNASDGSVTFRFWDDRLTAVSDGKGGQTRAVLMSSTIKPTLMDGATKGAALGQAPSTKDAAKTETAEKPKEPEKAPKAPEPPVKASPPAPAAAPQASGSTAPALETGPDQPKKKFFGRFRRKDWKNFTPAPDQMATPGQRAFYTFLVRSRGRNLSEGDLKPMGMRTINEKIEGLTKVPRVSEEFASFPQWKKLFFLLMEDLATAPEKALPILQGLSSIQATSQAIEKCLKAIAEASKATA